MGFGREAPRRPAHSDRGGTEGREPPAAARVTRPTSPQRTGGSTAPPESRWTTTPSTPLTSRTTTTAAETDDDGEDEHAQEHDGRDADDEHAAAMRPDWGTYLAARYVCTDPKTYGHVDRYRGNTAGDGRKVVAEMSEEEPEAARTQRRDVIESNKAWPAPRPCGATGCGPS